MPYAGPVTARPVSAKRVTRLHLYADALAAAEKAADTARERTALYLLNERLELLHEASPRTMAAGAVIA
ncbi:hypothetical protein ABZX65_22600 [Streptomyces sp. NPDC003300]|uniref:hypothetical protein n=1 Tax=unclassified Streptomyces TaxID=2593676 RepID=UPI0033BB6DB2